MEEILFTTKNFTGPLELLLFLAHKEEVEISDITLCPLLEQFVEQFVKWRNIEHAADFTRDFAQLICLKSSSLLPQQQTLSEDSPEELVSTHFLECLKAYSAIKEAAKTLHHQAEEQEYVYSRIPMPPPEHPPQWHPISLEEFSQVFAAVLQKAERRKQAIVGDTWSVAEKVAMLRKQLRGSKMLFDELFDPKQCREELIVTFLAVLELMKQQELFLVKNEEAMLYIHG